MILVDYVPLNVLEIVEKYYEKKDFPVEKYPRLGSGAYGCVRNVLGYAVKIFYGSSDQDGENLLQLQNHSAFPKLYAYEPQKYMICELIDGKRVADINRTDKIIDTWKDDYRGALRAIKSCGFYLSDLHANNVMLTKNGQLKIVDVGLLHDNGNSKSVGTCIDSISRYCDLAIKIEKATA